MSDEILDEIISNPSNPPTPPNDSFRKTLAGVMMGIGSVLAYDTVQKWYYYHSHPLGIETTVPYEIVFPINIITGWIIAYAGYLLWIKERSVAQALVILFFIFIIYQLIYLMLPLYF